MDSRVPISAAALLAELGDLRALARALVHGDTHASEDLVQATVAIALERPPRREGELGPWLRGVARRLRRLVDRGDARRRAREAAAATPARPLDPAELAGRLELIEILVEELRALPQPYRNTLLLRYFEDLGPAEIASRAGVPAATARSWLHRGLERLRERLDARSGRDRRSWQAALAAWTEQRPVPAAPRWPMALAAGAAVAISIGGITLAVAARADADAGTPPSSAHDATTDVAARDAPVPSHPPSATRIAAASAPLADHAAPPHADATAATVAEVRWIVHGRLLGLDPGTPWTSPLLIRLLDDSGADLVPPCIAELDDGGRYEAEVGAPRAALARLELLRVDADDPRYVPAWRGVEPFGPDGEPAGPGTRHRADLAVAVAVLATGRVVDEAARPIEGVELRAWPCAPDRALRSYATGRTDARGEYWLRAESTGEHQLVAEGAGRRRGGMLLELRRGVEARIPDLALEAGVAISGRVVDGSGRAIAGAGINAMPAPIAGLAARDGGLGPWVVRSVADEAGRFELRGLERGSWRVRVVSLPGVELHGALLGTLEREVAAPSQELQLEVAAARLEIEVASDGVAQSAALVMVGGGAAVASTDAGGRAAFLLPADRECDVVVTNDGALPRRLRVRPALGATTRERVELVPRAGPSLRLRLLEDERPLARAGVLLRRAHEPASKGFWMIPAYEEGRLHVGPLDPGRWRVELHPGARRPGGGGGYLSEVLDVELPASGDVERTCRVRPGGRLELFAVDENGVGLEAEVLLRDAAGEVVPCLWVSTEAPALAHAGTLWSNGFARADRALAPGRYRFELRHRGFRPLLEEAAIEARATTTLRRVLEREE